MHACLLAAATAVHADTIGGTSVSSSTWSGAAGGVTRRGLARDLSASSEQFSQH